MDSPTLAAATAIPRWPTTASPSYISSRNALLKEEYSLRAHIERVAALRRALPPGAIMPTYTFREGPADLAETEPIKETSLEDLASDGCSVVLYHFMFSPVDEEPCGMCSMIVDSFNGVGKHLAQNVTFAVVGKADITKLRAWALKRGWFNIRILSSKGSTFNRDMHVEDAEGGQNPGISVFRKDGEGVVRHVYTGFQAIEPGSERGLDLLASTYNVLDLVPEGRGEWYATNEYT